MVCVETGKYSMCLYAFTQRHKDLLFLVYLYTIFRIGIWKNRESPDGEGL